MALSGRFKLLFAAVVLAVSIFALISVAEDTDAAEEFTVDGVVYTTMDNYPGEVALKKYTSSNTIFTIPAEVEYKSALYRVTRVASQAFQNNAKIESVTIGSNVAVIESFAFAGCTKMSELSLCESLTTIGQSAFDGCTSLTEVILKKSIISIGTTAFARCAGLKDVTIDTSLRGCGTYIFGLCSGLEKVTIGSNVEVLPDSLFNECRKLISIKFDAVACDDLGASNYVFWNAGMDGAGITLSFGDSVQYIPAYLVRTASNTKVTLVEIGGSVGAIGAHALFDIDTLVDYQVVSYNDTFASVNGALYSKDLSVLFSVPRSNLKTDYYSPSELVKISTGAFSGNKNLISITLGKNVAEIEDGAFGAKKLEAINVESGNTNFQTWNGVLYTANYLRLITCPAKYSGIHEIHGNTERIDSNAFYNVTELTMIVIPGKVTYIGDYAFYGCSKITDIYYLAKCVEDVTKDSHIFCNVGRETEDGTCLHVEDPVEYLPSYLFYETETLPGIKTVEIGKGLKEIGKSVFASCYLLTQFMVSPENGKFASYNGNLISSDGKVYYCHARANTNYTIPETTEYIADHAFYGTKIDKLIIPSKVRDIGDYAFAENSLLEIVDFQSNALGTIGQYAFYNCAKLSCDLKIPAVKAIGDSAFRWAGITRLSLPDSLEEIGAYAFYDCRQMTEVNIPVNLMSMGAGAFNNCYKVSTVIYSAAKCEYNIASSPFVNLGYYASGTKVIIESSVRTFPGYMFSGCSFVDSLSIEDGVVEIRDYAFQATKITALSLPKTLERLGIGAFYKCYLLKGTNIPEGLKYMGGGAFSECFAMEYIEYSAAMCEYTSTYSPFGAVGRDAPYTAAVIKSSVRVIPQYLFNGCTYLDDIKIEDGATDVGKYAFNNCTSITGAMVVPSTVTNIGEYAYSSLQYSKELVYNAKSPILGSGAFYYYGNMTVTGTSLIIGNNVETIPDRLFSSSSAVLLGSVTFGTGLKNIGLGAFYGQKLLTSAQFNSDVETIGTQAFAGCTALTEFTIPESVTTIGYNLFTDCYSLKTVYFNAISCADVLAKYSTFWNAGKNVPEGLSIIIGDSVKRVPGYLCYIDNASFRFITSCTLGQNIEEIGDYAFCHLNQVSSLDLPDSIKTINQYAFYGWSLTSIDLPFSLETLKSYSFAGWSHLDTIIVNSDITSSDIRIFAGSGSDSKKVASVSVTIGDNVTSIAENLFNTNNGWDKPRITSIEFGENIRTIGAGAFRYLSILTSVTFSNGLVSIGDYAFSGTRPKNIAFPDTLKTIGEGAFQDAYISTSFSGIPSGVTSIGAYAFYKGVNKAVALNLSPTDGLTIGDYAFRECRFTTVTIGSGITEINEGVFYGDTSLTAVNFPSNLTSIGANAFYGCTSLLSVTVPSEVTVIGDSAFYGCSKIGNAVLNDCQAAIMDNAFASCSSMKSIDLGDKITSIGESAFYSCIMLTSVSFPSTVTAVGPSAFNKCTSLASVSLNDGLGSIGDLAFYECSNLASIVLPNSVQTIGDGAFAKCVLLQSADIGTGVTSIGKEVFKESVEFTSLTFRAVSCSDLTTDSAIFSGDLKGISVVFTDTVTRVPANLLRCEKAEEDSKIVSITLSSSIRTIGDNAFSNLKYLSSVNIPSGVEVIGNDAFRICIALETVTIGGTVTTIGDNAFSGCVKLQRAVMPDSVASVGSNAYSGCTELTEIRIGESVTYIGASAFNSCTALTSVSYHAVNCGDMAISDEVFYDSGILSAGMTVVIGDGVTKIPANLFYVSDEAHAPKIVSVTIGKGVLTIGDNAFRNCSALEQIQYCAVSCGNLGRTSSSFTRAGKTNGMTVTFSADVTGIPDYLFHSESSDDKVFIDELIIGENVESIGAYAFYGCDMLKAAALPAGMRTISAYSFSGSGLTSIDMSGSIQFIGESAFKDCTKIAAVTLGPMIETICDEAFSGCVAITSMVYGLTSATPDIGKDVFLNAGKSSSGITLNVSDGVNTIPSGLFYATEASSSPKILHAICGDSLQHVHANAFRGCSTLTDITFTSQLLSIGEYAFEKTGLMVITIPDSVGTIGVGAFMECMALNSVTLPASLSTVSEAMFKDSGLVNIEIPSLVTTIEKEAFSGCKGLLNIDMSQSLVSIKEYAFKDSGISVIRLDMSTLRTIGDHAFENCEELQYGNLGVGLESIGSYAFSNCSKMTALTIPETVTHIGERAFGETNMLSTLNYMAASIDDIGSDSLIFYKAGANTTSFSVTIGSTVEKVPDYLFHADIEISASPRITVLTINAGPTSIGAHAFDNCLELTTVNMSGSNISDIGKYAFSNCLAIEEISFSNDLLFIRESAFYNCPAIPEVTLPKYLMNIEDGAFYLDTSLKTVNNHSLLPIVSGSSSYGSVAEYVDSLDGIVVAGTSGDFGILYNFTSHTCKITSFSGFDSALTIPSTLKISNVSHEVIGVASNAFKDNTRLTEVAFSNNNALIESNAFSGCINLYSLTLSIDLRYIDADAIPGAKFFDTDRTTQLPVDKNLGGYIYSGPCDGNYYRNHNIVKYLIDGEQYGDIEVYMPNDMVTVRSLGVKTGYTVSAWSVPVLVEDGKFEMPVESVYIRATSTVNKYTISFDSNGGTAVASITQNYGSDVIAPKNPTKKGCTFYRWMYNGEPYTFTTMPAMNIKLTAEWTLNTYKVIYLVDRVEVFSDSYEYNSLVTIRPKYVKEGYTVSDWNVPTQLVYNYYKMLDYDVQITATTTINSYSVKYFLDGKEVEGYSETVQYGKLVVMREKISKEGYTVTDWTVPEGVVIIHDRDFYMPAFNVILAATSSINTYYVVYYVDTEEVFRDGYVYDSTYTIREKYVKEGYTVSDWDAQGSYKMPAYDVYVTASSKVNQYTIKFDSAGGSDVYPITQNYGTEIFRPNDPLRLGYTLLYWAENGKEFVFTTMPARNITLVAVWKVNQYTITFDSAGGTPVAPITQDYGTLVKQPNDPTLEGHRLRCWMEGINDYVFGLMPNHDVQLTASWNVNVYDIYYMVGGTVVDTDDSPYGETVEIREKYTIKGYTIGDWTVPEGITVVDNTFVMPAYDVYITATQTANYYTILFNSEGGTDVEPITQQYLTPVTKPADPYLEGMHLLNWMYNGEPYVFDLMPNENILLEAEWGPNIYKAKYYVGGELVIEEDHSYGSAVIIREPYIKEGYDVGEWTYDPTSIVVLEGYFYMPAYDVSFYAEQKVRSYTVNYYFDGEAYDEPKTYEYGTIVTVIDKPVKTGYTVSDWESSSVTITDGKFSMPDYNVNVECYSQVNSYNAIYKVDGKTVSTIGYKFGETVVIQDRYTKTGYEVSDWTVPEEIMVIDGKFVMPAYDVILTAQSSVRQYTVTYLIDGEQYGEIEKYNYSAQVKIRDKYVREGYTVKAWSYPSSVKPINGVFSMPDADVEITTTTSINEYKVSYYVDSSCEYVDKFYYGTTVTMRSVYVKEGYTVTDWVGPQSLVITDRTFVVPAYDVELDAFTTINTYSVTYLVDGEQVGSIEYYKYNTKVALRNDYEKTGYTVTTWEVPEPVIYGYFNVPAYDMKITAISQVNSYTVRYTVDGALYKSEQHDYGTTVTLIDKREIEGYDVTEWKGPDSIKVVDRKFIMVDSDVEFSSKTTVKVYKIYYYVEDELKFTDSAEYQSKVTMRAKYKITGYTAADWTMKDGVGPEIKSDRTFVMPAYDVSLKTTLTLNKHYVTYKVDGYAIDEPEVHWYNELVTVREPYVREGYTIQPWSKSGTFYMPDYDLTISTTSTVNKHYVTYYVDGTMIESTQYAYGTSITLREQYIKTGYTVTPWNVPVEVKNDKFFMPDFDVSITATTTINSYTITFDSNGGTEVEPMVATYGSPIDEPTPPTRVGYEFNCWTYNSRPYSFTTMPAYDLDLKASWNAVKYNVIYKVNGVVVDTEQYNYKDVVIVKDTYVKPGYTVTPWDRTDTFFMPAEDVTIRATSKINKYTITFDSQGGTSVSPITKYYGESIYKPTDPTLYGNTFLYWAKDGQEFVFTTMPAEDVLLSAVWIPNPHNVTYYINDKVHDVEIHSYGETVTVRDKYVKEGYRVSDWSITGTFVMPDADVDIRATAVINSHTVTYLVDDEQVGEVEVYMSLETVIIRDKYVKTGYTVSKWTVKTVSGEVVTTSSVKFDMPDADVVITATSKINKYSMYFNTNGGSYISSIKAEYGTFIERPDDPSKDGYVFLSWMLDDEPYEITTMPASNITLMASWMRDVQESDVYFDGNTNFIESKDTGVVLISAAASNKLITNSMVTLYINGTVETMSANTYRELYGGSEMSLNIKTSIGLENPKALSRLNVYDLNVVSKATLVTVKVTTSGKVSNLGEISVKVPYTVMEGSSASEIAVYFVSEEGDFVRMSSSYTKDGYVDFKTTHFSEFIICDHSLFIEKNNSGDTNTSQLSTVLIAVAVVAVGALIGGLMYYYFRRPSY